MPTERHLHDDAVAHVPAILGTDRAYVQADQAMRGGCLAPRWYVFIDDDRSYSASPVMIRRGR